LRKKKRGQRIKRRFNATVTQLCQGAEISFGECHNYSFPKHIHAEYTIGMVISGSESIYCQGSYKEVDAGCVYFHPPEQAHAGNSINGSAWKFVSLYLAPFFYKDYLESAPPEFNRSMLKHEKTTARYSKLIDVLKNSRCDVERVSILVSTIKEITRANMKRDNISPDIKLHSPAICRAKEFIQAYYSNAITLRDIAEVTGLSPGYFLECFKKSENITPHAYLLSVRLRAAKNKLLSGGTPADVAAVCGFYDQSHLNRHFLKVFGTTTGRAWK
jgi:AraC-like DNA-binding protein